MTIGETLKRARKKMGLDLDEVVAATKIAKIFLIALENDDISSLPKGVYTRNFLRTYARFLKLDEDILTTEYHEQFAIKPHFVTQMEQNKLDNASFVKDRNKRFLTVFLGIAIPAILAVLYFKYQEPVTQFWNNLFQQGAPAPLESPPNRANPLNQVDQPREKPGETEEPSGATGTEESSEKDVSNQKDGSEADIATDPNGSGDEMENQEKPEDIDPAGTNSDSAEDEKNLGHTQENNGSSLLPLDDLTGLTVYPQGSRPESLEDVFVIEGINDNGTWVKVTIDGQVITDRLLTTGQMRAYRYGSLQSVVIGDSSMVAIQSGQEHREQADQRRVYVRVNNFEPGNFLQALDQSISAELVRLREEQAAASNQEGENGPEPQ